MSGETEQRTKVLRVATRCVSIEQFVEAFARYCQKRTLYIASMTTRAPGSQSPVVILLADGSQAMRGMCEVVESWATPGGPYRRPGVRIKFLQLDAASESVLAKMHAFAALPPAAAASKTVLPPLPPLRTAANKAGPPPTPSIPAIPAPPPRSPVLPPFNPKQTISAPVVPMVALQQRAPSPQRIATIPPLVEDAQAAPPPAPPVEDEPKTDVDASPDALRAIRAATAARAAAPDSPFEDIGALDKLAAAPSAAEMPASGDERTPGSPFILPANPLAEINDDALRGFVECTLYEETGKFSFDDLLDRTGEDSDAEDPIIEPPLPPELKPIPRRDQTPIPRRDQTPIPRRDQTPIPEAAPVAAAVVAATAPGPAPIAPSEAVAPSRGADSVAEGSSPAGVVPHVVSQPPPWPQPEAPPWPGAQPANPQEWPQQPPVAAPPVAWPVPQPAFHLPVDVDPPEPPGSPRRGPLIVGIAAAALIGGFAVYLVMRGGSEVPATQAAATPSLTDAAVPPPALDAAPAPIATMDPLDAGATDAEDDADAEEPDDPAEDVGAVRPPDPPDLSPLPTGDCALEVTSTPPGALVRAEGRVRGDTPVTLDLPCGRARIVVSRQRYADVEKVVVLTAGTPSSLKVSLLRPDHRLKLASTPGGATVSIGGKKVGTTPTTITVPGFTMLQIEMRRAGYKTLRTKHYSKKTGGVVAGRLEKGS